MRTNANQCELPLDAPFSVVIACRSEADAVRTCLRLAFHKLGRDQEMVAALCGWKSDSCLSEIAKESNPRTIPAVRLERFARATGCNLVAQYRARIEAEHRRAGRITEREEADDAAAVCMAAWGHDRRHAA